MDASNKQETISDKFVRVWEKKNAKAARAGGVSLMALSLAACGGSSSTTTTTTPAATAGDTITLSSGTDTVSASSGSINGSASTARFSDNNDDHNNSIRHDRFDSWS
jgi:hypothetical protein